VPGFPQSILAPFCLCGRPLPLAAILEALSPHPKFPFLADNAQRLTFLWDCDASKHRPRDQAMKREARLDLLEKMTAEDKSSSN
jgi:hypothetical protein